MFYQFSSWTGGGREEVPGGSGRLRRGQPRGSCSGREWWGRGQEGGEEGQKQERGSNGDAWETP